MNFKKVQIFSVAVAASLILGSAAFCDETADTGRALVAKWQNAVIGIKVVAKMSMSYGGKDSTQEQKNEAVGCVIDASGLVVTTLKETDPSSIIEEMPGGQGEKLSVSAEITDVKYVMADGKEIAAKVILRDKDLDLAFLRPVKKLDAPMTSLDLSKTAKPTLFDQIIILSRQGAVGNRAISVSLDRISSILEKPRTLYIPDGYGDFGNPTFAMDGNLIGIMVMKQLPKGSSSASGWKDTMAQVIMPAADIAEVAKQAPATADAVKDTPAIPASSKPVTSTPKPSK